MLGGGYSAAKVYVVEGPAKAELNAQSESTIAS
jgi:hypothetical protein